MVAPQIDVAITTDKEAYQPGDTVSVDLTTQFAGKPIPAHLTVSVVDEMVYALQPEVAPTIDQFFYHPRRNNVRTSASLSFISYDVALPGSPGAPGKANRSERGVKVLERPRREDVDTAAWQPELITDANGKTRFTFKMPDSLTRWRITARAIADDGQVGQKKQFVRSEKKPLYLKWSGPSKFRNGDKPDLGVFAFSQAEKPVKAELVIHYAGAEQRVPVTLNNGINYIALPAFTVANGEWTAELVQDGKTADALAVRLTATGEGWQVTQSQSLDVASGDTPLTLPADATDIRLRLDDSPQALFRSALDDLLSYPYGGVEQTASRLLPLSIAYPTLSSNPQIRDRLRLIMQNSRLRLVQMAGPSASFTWWGYDGEPDAFLTAYAYYADWHASKALELSLPPEHWQRVLDVYAKQAQNTPLLQRALILSFAKQMQLPVNTLLSGLIDDLVKAGEGHAASMMDDGAESLVMSDPDSALGLASARVLTASLARQAKVNLPSAFNGQLEVAQQQVAVSSQPFVEALNLSLQAFDQAHAQALLQRLLPQQSTLERALALTWLQRSIEQASPTIALAPGEGWKKQHSATGEMYWTWQGAAPVPTVLSLTGEQERPLRAALSFQSKQPPVAPMAVTITRRLSRLVPGDEAFEFKLEAVGSKPLSSDSLYLDEVIVTSKAAKPLRYGMLEVPLPPGADVERTTWGIKLMGKAGTEPTSLEKARFEPGQLAYAIPVDALSGELRLRHLVRFSQKKASSICRRCVSLKSTHRRTRLRNRSRHSVRSRFTDMTRRLVWWLLCLMPALATAQDEPLRLGFKGELLSLSPTQVISREPLPADVQTPLGSLWKLFVYGWLVDTGAREPAYECRGQSKEEVYCCTAGGRIERDQALVKSCGLYFEPARLGIAGAQWREYWQARQAPKWLLDLPSLQPQTRVSVAELLKVLAVMPAQDQARRVLLDVVLNAADGNVVGELGGRLRVKTWSWLGGSGSFIASGRVRWLDGGRHADLGRRARHQSNGLAQLRSGTGDGVAFVMASGGGEVRRGRPVRTLSAEARTVGGIAC